MADERPGNRAFLRDGEESNTNLRFLRDLHRAQQLYSENKLDQCEALAGDLLRNPATPRWHRIKTEILLAYVVANAVDARGLWRQAKRHWGFVFDRTKKGVDPKQDRVLTALKADLDELKAALDEEDTRERAEQARKREEEQLMAAS